MRSLLGMVHVGDRMGYGGPPWNGAFWVDDGRTGAFFEMVHWGRRVIPFWNDSWGLVEDGTSGPLILMVYRGEG